MGLAEDFELAAEAAKTLPGGIDNMEKLKLYALYKQSKLGDVNTDRPGLLDQKGRAKWDMWSKEKGKKSEDSMSEYITYVEELKGKYQA